MYFRAEWFVNSFWWNTLGQFIFSKVTVENRRFELEKLIHIEVFEGKFSWTWPFCGYYWWTIYPSKPLLWFNRVQKVRHEFGAILIEGFCKFKKSRIIFRQVNPVFTTLQLSLIELMNFLIDLFGCFLMLNLLVHILWILFPCFTESFIFLFERHLVPRCIGTHSKLSCYSGYTIETPVFWLLHLHIVSYGCYFSF